MQPIRLNWVPRRGGWEGLFWPDTLCARELYENLYVALSTNNYLVWMNDGFPLIMLSNERYICAPLRPTLHGWNLIFTNTSWDWSRPTATANKVCSDSTCNEPVKTSVYRITFDGCSAYVTLFSSRKNLLFWKVFDWLRVICISTKAAVLLHKRFWRRLDILIFCQNKIIVSNWNKRQKMTGWTCCPVEAKNLTQIMEKIFEVFAQVPSLLCPQNYSALLVGRASTHHLPPHQTLIVISLFASVNR